MIGWLINGLENVTTTELELEAAVHVRVNRVARPGMFVVASIENDALALPSVGDACATR